MARLWQFGAELNSATNGVEISTFGGTTTPTISTAAARSGNFGAFCSRTGTAGSSYIEHQFKTGTSSGVQYYLRAYIKIVTATAGETVLMGIQDTTGTGVGANITLSSDNTLRLRQRDGTLIGSASSALNSNQWYRIEMQVEEATSGADMVGRIDGTNFASTATGAGDTDLKGFFVGIGHPDGTTGTTGTGEIYVDDVALNDNAAGGTQTSFPGPGRLTLAMPTGAGDNAATAGTYDDVFEIPPSSTATSPGDNIIELDTTTTNADYKVTSPTAMGIDPTSRVNVISVVIRVREETAGASNYTMRLKSASGGTTTVVAAGDAGDTTVRTNPTSTTTSFTQRLMSYTDPTTAAAWTVTGTNSLTNMQVGTGTTDGNPDTWVLWLGAYIDYTPPELSQEAFRFYEDGTEAGSTAIDTQGTDITRTVDSDSNLQLRLRLQNNTDAAGASTDDYLLQYSKNGGAYKNVDQSVELVDQNFMRTRTTSQIVQGGTGNFQEAAQSFVPQYTGTLTKITVPLAKIAAPTDNLFVEVTSSLGGAALATSNNVTGASLGLGFVDTDITFGSPASITAGNTYYLVFKRSGARDTTNYFQIAGNESLNANGSYWRNNSGSWTEFSAVDLSCKVFTTVSAGTDVVGFNSGSLTNGNATTNRLTGGTGSFVAGEICEDGLVDDFTHTASNYTEHLYSVTIESTAVANNDTLDFRVLRNSCPITYNDVPRITVSQSAGGDLSINKSESVTVSETVQRMLESFVNKSDSVTVAENADPELVSDVNVSDSVSVAESVDPELVSLISKSDSVSVAEAVTPLIPELHIVVSDSSTVTENVDPELVSFISKSEAVSVAESVKAELESLVSVSDSASVAEALQRLLESNPRISDSVSVAEAVTAFIPELVPNVSENVSVSESIKLLLESYINKSESVSVAENTVVEFGLASDLAVNVSDSSSVSESVKSELNSFISKSESASVAESRKVELESDVRVSDSASVAESVDPEMVSFINKSESVTVSESVSVFIPELHITKSDSVSVAESVSVSIPTVTHQISVSDTISGNASVSASKSIIFLLDGRIAVRISDGVYLPL